MGLLLPGDQFHTSLKKRCYIQRRMKSCSAAQVTNWGLLPAWEVGIRPCGALSAKFLWLHSSGEAQAGWPPSFHRNSRSLSQHCSSLWLASKHLPVSCAAAMPSGEGWSEADPTEVVGTNAALLATSRWRQSRAPGSCGWCGDASSWSWLLTL